MKGIEHSKNFPEYLAYQDILIDTLEDKYPDIANDPDFKMLKSVAYGVIARHYIDSSVKLALVFPDSAKKLFEIGDLYSMRSIELVNEIHPPCSK